MSLSIFSVIEIRKNGKWNAVRFYSTDKYCNKYYSHTTRPYLLPMLFQSIRSYFKFRKAYKGTKFEPNFRSSINYTIQRYKEEYKGFKKNDRKQYKFKCDTITNIETIDFPFSYDLKHNYLNTSSDDFVGIHGIPDDCDSITKAIFDDYHYGISTIYLSTISDLETKAKREFINDMKQYINDGMIGKIARKVGVKTKKEDMNFKYDLRYYSSEQEMIDEMISKFESLLSLESSIRILMENLYSSYNDSDVRLITFVG